MRKLGRLGLTPAASASKVCVRPRQELVPTPALKVVILCSPAWSLKE